MKFSGLLSALGVNAIPAIGWFAEGWSPGTMLAVYWFENFSSTLFVALKLLVHWRISGLQGYSNYSFSKNSAVKTKHFLVGFVTTAGVFVGAHAIFLGLLLGVIFPQKFGPDAGIHMDSFLHGAVGVTAFLTLDFLVSLFRMRTCSFRRMEEATDRIFGRIVLVQLVIIGGMFFTFLTDSTRAMFGIFIALKTLTDIGSWFPQYKPKNPPKWMSKALNRVGPKAGKESFDDFWHREDQEEAARQAKNERTRK